MECQTSDSKKLFNVFDASKRKRARKKCDGFDDSNSVATEDSISGCQGNVCRMTTAKASLQNLSTPKIADSNLKRELSSPSMTRSPIEVHYSPQLPRRHRRSTRDNVSLALKAGMVSTPRSISPQDRNGGTEHPPRDQDSIIYAFLEEAIKRDKKKQRHGRRHEGRHGSRDRDGSVSREHRHHRRRRDDQPSREHESTKAATPTPAVNEAVLLQTFAKLCAQMNENNRNHTNESPAQRTLSNKSLQCEVVSRRDSYKIDPHSVRTRYHNQTREEPEPSRIRSDDNFHERVENNDSITKNDEKGKCGCFYESDKCGMGYSRSRIHSEDQHRGYQDVPPTRGGIDHYRVPGRSYREYERRDDDYDKRRSFEQKTSRSFDAHREGYEEERCRRTARSDNIKRYDDKLKMHDDRERSYQPKPVDMRDHLSHKNRRSRRNLERYEKNSIASREEDFRERFSDREQDSGLSVADGEVSTVSGKSNYLRAVKQEISEQREAMDKMMKLWKELMRCFKGFSQVQQQGQDKNLNESASNVRDSAAAQLRLWRECMRRYETVARDVGDTDARLMEEINKQRSEMAEMSSMWQECLQRYRDISNDFNSLKQQLATSESPTRMPAQPLVSAEGEGMIPQAPYRVPPNYPPMPTMVGYPNGGSPLRSRASAPPAWWWCGDAHRRQSSPDSRGSRDRDRDRDRKHRHKDRDESRYKEKSKPGAARSEHRHRKR